MKPSNSCCLYPYLCANPIYGKIGLLSSQSFSLLTSDLCTQHSLSPGNAFFGPWFLFTEYYSRLVHNAASLEILPSSSSSCYYDLNSQINPVILYNILEDVGMCLLYPLFQNERSFILFSSFYFSK